MLADDDEDEQNDGLAEDMFVSVDPSELRSEAQPEQPGCTAVVCLVILGEKEPRIVVANGGDSRCVVGKANGTMSMTDDHKPENPEETRRIEAAGGKVVLNLFKTNYSRNYIII